MSDPRPSGARGIARFVSSIRMAVPLLLIIGTVLAYGTLYESRYGAKLAQQFIYHAWWFDALLALLALNVVGAAVVRYPWKPHLTGFVITHAGLLVTLVGAVLTHRLGFEGELALAEGETRTDIVLDRSLLRVTLPTRNVSRVFPTDFDCDPRTTEIDRAWPIEGTPYRLRVDRYFPNPRVDLVVTDTGETDNPALELELERGPEHAHPWLFARDTERRGVDFGPLGVYFLDVPDPGKFAELLQLAAVACPGAAGLPQGNALLLVRGPGGGLHSCATGAGAAPVHAPCAVGTEYVHAPTGYRYRVKNLFLHARASQEWTNLSAEPTRPHIRVRVDADASTATEWVGLDDPRSFEVGGEPILIEYARRTRPLGFALTLNHFKHKRYQGTEMPASFESFVKVEDPRTGASYDYPIYMNNPLAHAGMTFYQSSFQDGTPPVSIFQVACDPGCPVTYAGFGLICFGIVTMFYLKPYLSGRRAATATNAMSGAAADAHVLPDAVPVEAAPTAWALPEGNR